MGNMRIEFQITLKTKLTPSVRNLQIPESLGRILARFSPRKPRMYARDLVKKFCTGDDFGFTEIEKKCRCFKQIECNKPWQHKWVFPHIAEDINSSITVPLTSESEMIT